MTHRDKVDLHATAQAKSAYLAFDEDRAPALLARALTDRAMLFVASRRHYLEALRDLREADAANRGG